MSYTQKFISKYLVAELYHTLGSYGSASKIYTSLWEERKSPHETNSLSNKYSLEIRSMYNEELMRHVKKFNCELHQEIHATRSMQNEGWKEYRHPKNDIIIEKNGVWTVGDGFGEKLQQILYFYEAAIKSLKNEDQDNLSYFLIFETTIPSRHTFLDADNLIKRREESKPRRRNAKILRYEMLLREAKSLLVSDFNLAREEQSDQYNSNIEHCIEQLVDENLNYEITPDPQHDKKTNSFRSVIFDLLNASHMMIHTAEHLRSFGYEKQMKDGEQTLKDIKRNIPLVICISTFIYNVARNIPWIFAADATERDYIKKLHRQGAIYKMPPRCMWIATQVSLLALYRRAYARGLMGEKVAESFNDYLKVQNLARVARRIYNRTATPVAGGRDWLNALESMTEYRMGELYRVDHAHNKAFVHFCRGFDRLDNLTHSDEMKPIIEESHVRIKLMLSKGKGFYELGYLKRSLKWYVKAWKSFLIITSLDGDLETNNKSIDELIQWLERIKFDPDLSKRELIKHLEPLSLSIESTRVSFRLQGLAADILNRLAHCLYVLKLDSALIFSGGTSQPPEEKLHDLSRRILKKAYFLDSKNTLIKSNYLKTLKGSNEALDNIISKFNRERKTGSGGMQWPHAKSEFERFARLYEHFLLQDTIAKRFDDKNNKATLEYISSSMLVDFLSHTDSINVKLAQTYRYLMRASTPGINSTGATYENDSHIDSEETIDKEKIIEFVCLRRYSSFFPFLPRPSAFDVLGGGYLFRVYGDSKNTPNGWYSKQSPLGIAIDPGPNFIDNLYRAEFSLEDIDMIIVTHDHPDHMSSLDPLLSLIQYKSSVGGTKFKSAPTDGSGLQRPLPIICNSSVFQRYKTLNGLYNNKKSFVYFCSYEDWHPKDADNELLTQFHEEINSIGLELLFNKGQHKDTSLENDSLGVKISIKNGPSVGITSDTGYFGMSKGKKAEAFKLLDEEDYHHSDNIEKDDEWATRWNDVLDSDVLVTHVSSIPLPQLRHFSHVGVEGDDWKKNTGWLKEVTNRLEGMGSEEPEQRFYKQVMNQIDFAFWMEKDKRPLFSQAKLPDVPGNHLYLAGIYKFAEEYLNRRRKGKLPGLFVVSELREELATFRTKIASNLNGLFDHEKENHCTVRAITADVGLTVIVKHTGNPEENIKVLCGGCSIDNDYSNDEKYHLPENIVEVCVKGEDEGIFYNCKHHDPGSLADPNFIEKFERYDIFGRLQP